MAKALRSHHGQRTTNNATHRTSVATCCRGGAAVLAFGGRIEPALPGSAMDDAGRARCLRLLPPHADSMDLHRHAARRGDRTRLPQRRDQPARARAYFSAADQDHHCAAAVRNPGSRHRRPLQSATGWTARPALDHLLRDRHHDCDLPRTWRHQSQQGGRGCPTTHYAERRDHPGQQAQRGGHHPAHLSRRTSPSRWPTERCCRSWSSA